MTVDPPQTLDVRRGSRHTMRRDLGSQLDERFDVRLYTPCRLFPNGDNGVALHERTRAESARREWLAVATSLSFRHGRSDFHTEPVPPTKSQIQAILTMLPREVK